MAELLMACGTINEAAPLALNIHCKPLGSKACEEMVIVKPLEALPNDGCTLRIVEEPLMTCDTTLLGTGLPAALSTCAPKLNGRITAANKIPNTKLFMGIDSQTYIHMNKHFG